MGYTTITIQPLITGNHGPLFSRGTVASGQDLVANSVLGKISVGGEFQLCDKASVDGSEVAVGVLTSALDTTSASEEVDLLRHAQVDEELLVFGGASTIDDHREQLVVAGIYPEVRG